MKKKRGLLHQLIIAIFIPAFLALILAWVVYNQFESTMRAVSGNYVENLVDSVAARLDSQKWNIRAGGRGVAEGDAASMGQLLSEMDIPGLFAVFHKDGAIIYESPGEIEFLYKWKDSFNSRTPVKIHDKIGSYYTGVRYDIPNENIYIIGAVSWEMLFGTMVLLVSLWPFVMAALAAFTLLAIFLLYYKVILPLRRLDREILSLSFGRDMPAPDAPGAVPELRQLRSTFALLAQAAIEKEKLQRDYVTDIVKVQEDEREWISREIHDGPLQDATALVQRLRLLKTDLADNPEVVASLSGAERVAMIGVKELRELCNDLTPPWLDLGLRHSMTELCNRMSAQLGVEIELDISGEWDEDEEVQPQLCLAFYRVAQESINNSVHHGRASDVQVSLAREADKIVMTVKDNGDGFAVPVSGDFRELRVRGHRGLSNMSERIRLAGGTIEIKSTVGIGTVIRCEVPAQRVE